MSAGFLFQTTPSILSRPGASGDTGETLRRVNVARALFVTDAGILSHGLAEPALASARAAGIATEIYGEVVADPPESVVLAALEQARAFGADGIVGLGGGSSLDVAKLVAYLLKSGEALEAIYGVGMCTGERLPLVQIPTTAGTGSEVTPISIITTGKALKKGVVSPQLLADWAILDAELTYGLPPHVTAATGIDAMVHAIEAYTSKRLKNPLSDALAREALRLLSGAIRTACADGADTDARGDMLLGSLLAGMAFANAPCAAVHALAYPIGGHFKVPHGLSNAMVLAPVLRFNAIDPAAAQLYAELAPIVFPERVQAGESGATAVFIEGLSGLAGELALDVRLTSVGISHNHLPMLAEEAMKQTRLLINNPREVGLEDAKAIYSEALDAAA